jgi:regulator of protease activity HflC (stomatin/prohibitin superfamily)
MEQLIHWLSNLFSSWKWWVVVAPWDNVIRVRLGKRAKVLGPGLHFQIPLIDRLMTVNTRLRIQTSPPVTLNVNGRKARVVTATIGYRIVEPLKAVMMYANPDPAIMAYAQAEATKLAKAEECQETLREAFSKHGIEIEFVRYVEDVQVHTIRLMQHGPNISTYETGTPQIPRY